MNSLQQQARVDAFVQEFIGELPAEALAMKCPAARPEVVTHVSGTALPEAMEAIQKYGSMIKSPSGFPVQSPYLAIANRQTEIMMRIASEFGFTPASRSRISTSAPDEQNLLDLMEEDLVDEESDVGK
jgi:hypothetical protein